MTCRKSQQANPVIWFPSSRRRLQQAAAHYLLSVLGLLRQGASAPWTALSARNEADIVRDSLLLRYLLANNFGTSTASTTTG